jgi:hypothetical protein
VLAGAAADGHGEVSEFLGCCNRHGVWRCASGG